MERLTFTQYVEEQLKRLDKAETTKDEVLAGIRGFLSSEHKYDEDD